MLLLTPIIRRGQAVEGHGEEGFLGQVNAGARLEELAQVCGEAGLVLLLSLLDLHLEIAQLGPQWLGVVLPVDSSASQPPGRRHHGRADIDGVTSAPGQPAAG